MVSRNALIIGTTFGIGAAVTGAYLLMTLGKAGSGQLQRFAKPALSLAVPHGWTVEEEPNPLSNVTLLNFSNPAFAAEPQEVPGAEPMLKLSVEDMTGSGISMTNFVPVSRGMTMQQLEAMTGGAIKPKVLVDEAMSVGIFEHSLRYSLDTPDASLHLLALLTVRDGLAYLLQLFGPSRVVDCYKHKLLDIAKSIVPESKPLPAFDPKEGSSVTVTTDTLKVSVPAAWMPVERKEGFAQLSFRTPAIAAPEVVLVFLAKDRPNKLPSDGRVVDITVGEYPTKAVSNGTYTITCGSQNPKAAVVTSGETLEAVLASITPSSAAAPPVYRNVEQGYEFALAPQYKLQESRLGDGKVVYAPEATPAPGAIESDSTVDVVGGSDPVAEGFGASADECYAAIAPQVGQMPGVEIEKVRVGENDAVVTKGITDEFCTGSHLFFKDGKLTSLTWNTKDWKSFEGTLDAMVASLKLL